MLDASAAIAAVTGRTESPRILEKLSEASSVLAPDLYVAEVTNAFRKYVTSGAMAMDEAADALDAAMNLVDQTLPVAAFAQGEDRGPATAREATYIDRLLSPPVPR